MTDELSNQIKSAQSAPSNDYMVWAEVDTGTTAQSVILHTVRLPQSLPPDIVVERIRGHARKTLSDVGFSDEQVETAELKIGPLPDAEEARAELEANLADGAELVLVDVTAWESFRLRLGLKPQLVDGELEMDYKGLKIRRSAAG